MFGNLHIEALAKALRMDATRIELDDVVFHLPCHDPVPAPFPAAVSADGHKLSFHLRIPASSNLPEALRPYFDRNASGPVTIETKDCYRITAHTDHGLSVVLDSVHPQPSETSSSGNTHCYTVEFSHIEIPATGTDAMNGAEMRVLWADIHARHPEAKQPSPEVPPTPPDDYLVAILSGVKLQILTQGTENKRLHPFHGEQPSSKLNCFIGEVDGGEFCLEATETGDLLVYFLRPLNTTGARFEAAHVMSGILTAIGYTHGCHPWPFYREHRRDHRVIERWIKTRGDIQRHGLLPMEAGRLHHSKDAQALFVTAAEFFASKSESARLHSRAQWLMREACPKQLPFELRLMTLCILFEGLLRELEKHVLTPAEREHPRDGGLTRREKWQQSVERSGLPWAGVFEHYYESWDFYRSPLAHGFQERSQETTDTVFNAYSRLSAALHILLARETAYIGPLAKSILEGNEAVLITRRPLPPAMPPSA